jgi:hypothetical protein
MNKPLSLWLLNLQIALRFLSTALVPLWVVRALIEKASNKDKHWKEICIMAFADEMQHGRLNDFLFIISITTIIALPFYLLIYWRGIDDRGIVFLVLSAIVAYLAIRREWKNDYKDRHDFKVFCSWPVSKRCLYVFLGLCLCTVASLIIIFIYFA